MSTTLTLSIPFILLGRRDTNILDPSLLTDHERAIEPIKLISQTLQHFCPTIPIAHRALTTFDSQATPPEKLTASQRRAHADAQRQTQTAEEEDWHAPATGWVLRPAPSETVFMSTVGMQGWREGDGCFSREEKKALRPETGVWSCPVLLQRFGIPLDTKSARWMQFAAETREIFSVLERAFVGFRAAIDGVEGRARYWDLVVGERCVLKTVVEQVDEDCGKRVLLLCAAFERELDMLRCTREVVGFVGVGRWLEWMLLRKMAKEEREAWRDLGKGRHRMDGGGQWKSSISADNERCRRTKGRDREWWEVMLDLSDTEIIEGMHEIENGTKTRLSISLQRPPNEPHRITFQGHRSTLDADHLIAHTELLGRITDTAQSHSTEDLAELLEIFQILQPTSPMHRFSHMLEFLGQANSRFSDASKQALAASIDAFECAPRSENKTAAFAPPRPKPLREILDPFMRLRTHIEARHAEEKADMARFVERYDAAGGYAPTTEKKLRAILRARGIVREVKARLQKEES